MQCFQDLGLLQQFPGHVNMNKVETPGAGRTSSSEKCCVMDVQMLIIEVHCKKGWL